MVDVTTFVAARHEFDGGHGPADAWDRLHRISMDRLRELAERDGAGSWATLIGAVDTLAGDAKEQAMLIHTLRSMGYAHIRCRVYWQNTATVLSSEAVVVPRLSRHQATRIAQRRRQLAVLLVTTAPARVEVVNVATGEQLSVDVVDVHVIAETLAIMFGTFRVAIEYVPTGWFEGLACSVAERRLRTTFPRQ